jgi:NADPH:quinone reductase-like Zn-dependent oxidoreductase
MIREAYPVKSGEIVLVHAAAGGVGLWLTQLLKAIGARVIATASTEEKLQLAKENGAEFLVNYAKEDWVAKVKEITDGKGVPAIFDGVGASTFEGGLEAIAKKGTFVSFGNASGAVPPFAIARLGGKNIKLMRTRLFPYVDTYEEFTQYTAELLDFVKTGKVNVRIHKTYDLKDVKQAHNDIEGRVTTGKLLLKI